jgi:membrane fusion protein (multidrug efflux system)
MPSRSRSQSDQTTSRDRERFDHTFGRRIGVGFCIAVMAFTGSGCGQTNVYQAPPPPEVIVVNPVRQAVVSYLEYTGTAQAVEKVELRARVKGFLKEKLFNDGADVEKDQLLFVIDEEPFKILLEQARAKLSEAEASLRKAEQSRGREIAQAQLDLDQSQLVLSKLEESRTRNLLSRNASSREDLDRAEATRKKAEAQVAADQANLDQANSDYEINILAARSSLAGAKANVRNAEIDLGYCRITSPIKGRINSREFDIGNYVGDGQSTVLATVVRSDEIYAWINLSESDLLRVQAMVRQGKRKDYRDAEILIEMGLANEDGFPHTGRIDYTDPTVDPGTGTIRVRGLFENSNEKITPGLFVRVRMPIDQREDALLVPDRALSSDQIGSFLLIVDKDNKVERRDVKLGTEVKGMRVIEGKLDPEERVVVDGLLRARPGIVVAPKVEGTAVASK